MAVVEVRFYGLFRLLADRRAAVFELADEASLRSLIWQIIQRYPETGAYLVDSCGELRQDAPVFVDGRNPRLSAAGLDAPLPAQSVVSLFSAIASGKMNVEALRCK